MSRKPFLGYQYIQDMKNWHAADETRTYAPLMDNKKAPLHRGTRIKLEELGVKFNKDIVPQPVRYSYDEYIEKKKKFLNYQSIKIKQLKSKQKL